MTITARTPVPRPARRGSILPELGLTSALLLLGLVGFARVGGGLALAAEARAQRQAAREAAAERLEALRGQDPALALARHDADPGNDPDGPGTAPGRDFAVPGLEAVAGDSDRLPGELSFGVPRGEALPVTARVRWRTPSGPAELELTTLLGGL